MTREQIGRALECKEPRKYIAKIHERNADRLDSLDVYKRQEIDRAFGFIGSDVFENGIVYSVGCSLEKAVKEYRYRIGCAEKVVTVNCNFDKC